MKVLNCNYEYYLFPDGINSLKEFVDYVNQHFNTFIPLVRLKTDNCVAPYFIEEDRQLSYVNFSSISSITEEEAEVMPRKEYDVRLEQTARTKCVNCHYFEASEPLCDDNTRSFLCLNGKCSLFIEKKKTEE